MTRVRLWRRLAAISYDLLLVLALLMVVTAIVIVARRGAEVDPGALWFQCLLLAGWWLYFAWFWTHGGQTVGMRIWKLRLIAADADSVSWARATLRFFGAWVSTAACGLGFLWSVFDRDQRTWHGRVSRTSLRFRQPSPQA